MRAIGLEVKAIESGGVARRAEVLASGSRGGPFGPRAEAIAPQGLAFGAKVFPFGLEDGAIGLEAGALESPARPAAADSRVNTHASPPVSA